MYLYSRTVQWPCGCGEFRNINDAFFTSNRLVLTNQHS